MERKRRKGSGGKEKKKVKLNKFHFSAFNLLEHGARRKLGEGSACFSSDGFSSLNIKLMKQLYTQTNMSFIFSRGFVGLN